MKKTVGDNLEVKASGGVRNIEDMEELIKAGVILLTPPYTFYIV